MAKLPATIAEAEALAYAQDWVRRVRDEKVQFFGLALSWFAKADNERLAIQVFKEASRWPEGMMDVANLARVGEPIAKQACRELILEYAHRNEAMPPPLHTYNMEIIRGQRVYGLLPAPKKASYLLRDIAITVIVGDVCWKFSLKSTRQRASKRERLSGCGVVALALANEHMALGESAVVNIWTRYGRIVFPNGAAVLGSLER